MSRPYSGVLRSQMHIGARVEPPGIAVLDGAHQCPGRDDRLRQRLQADDGAHSSSHMPLILMLRPVEDAAGVLSGGRGGVRSCKRSVGAAVLLCRDGRMLQSDRISSSVRLGPAADRYTFDALHIGIRSDAA